MLVFWIYHGLFLSIHTLIKRHQGQARRDQPADDRVPRGALPPGCSQQQV